MRNIKKQNTRDPRTYAIIGAAMEVHRIFGRGFLEPVYQDALEKEFKLRGILYAREVELPVTYKRELLNASYRVDFVCFDSVMVELKALSELGGKEEAQIINYLKASVYEVGLLVNFGADSLQFTRFAQTHDSASLQSAESAQSADKPGENPDSGLESIHRSRRLGPDSGDEMTRESAQSAQSADETEESPESESGSIHRFRRLRRLGSDSGTEGIRESAESAQSADKIERESGPAPSADELRENPHSRFESIHRFRRLRRLGPDSGDEIIRESAEFAQSADESEGEPGPAQSADKPGENPDSGPESIHRFRRLRRLGSDSGTEGIRESAESAQSADEIERESGPAQSVDEIGRES